MSKRANDESRSVRKNNTLSINLYTGMPYSTTSGWEEQLNSKLMVMIPFFQSTWIHQCNPVHGFPIIMSSPRLFTSALLVFCDKSCIGGVCLCSSEIGSFNKSKANGKKFTRIIRHHEFSIKRDYRSKMKDTLKIKKQQYYEENKEHLKKQRKHYNHNNKDTIKVEGQKILAETQRGRQYQQNNKEMISEKLWKMKQYRAKSKDKWQNISETATTTQWKETINNWYWNSWWISVHQSSDNSGINFH